MRDIPREERSKIDVWTGEEYRASSLPTAQKNPLKPKTYFIYRQVKHLEILCSAHNAFMCFTWISDQTATISLYSVNWLVFITEAESVYCAVRTVSLNKTDTDSSLKEISYTELGV
jgi:hypothetical protein